MADGRRKGRSAKHAGVVLKKRVLPSGALSWRARYRDPDTGAMKYETLPDEHAATDEQRRAWAEGKAAALRDRARELEKGAPRKKGAALAAVLEVFYEDGKRKRPATLATYRKGSDALLAFAAERGVTKGDDLRPEHLAAFREWLSNRPRAGAPDALRSGFTVNKDLRSVKAVLNHVRRQGLLPFITMDSLRDNLKPVATPKEGPEYLEAHQLRALLAACDRHDADCFAITRDEKGTAIGSARRAAEIRRARGTAPTDAPLPSGSTPRYDPIKPYVLVLLLSGMRASEAATLTWAQVDLDAAPAGRIKLTSATKTRAERVVDLSVSPALRALLTAMKLKAGARYVFGADEPTPDTTTRAALRRLLTKYGAPTFTWQTLRSTCATFLTNAGGIFGAASAYRSAKQLGHGVQVAEKFYLGVVHVDPKATTLEAAMGIADLLGARGSKRPGKRKATVG